MKPFPLNFFMEKKSLGEDVPFSLGSHWWCVDDSGSSTCSLSFGVHPCSVVSRQRALQTGCTQPSKGLSQCPSQQQTPVKSLLTLLTVIIKCLVFSGQYSHLFFIHQKDSELLWSYPVAEKKWGKLSVFIVVVFVFPCKNSTFWLNIWGQGRNVHHFKQQ